MPTLADDFAWFAWTNPHDGEELRLEHITALDVQQYHQHLLQTPGWPRPKNDTEYCFQRHEVV